MDIKFLTQENEIQKLYSKFGLVVPVGDLETGKAPAIQPLPVEVTNDKVTFNFNVMSNAEIAEISYETDHMDQGTITPKKGMISISFDRNPIDTMYEIGITVTNENGSTYAGQLAEFPIIPDWATANEVLEGNKFIGEDGQEAVGTYVPEDTVNSANGVFSNIFDQGWGYLFTCKIYNKTEGGLDIQDVKEFNGVELYVEGATIPVTPIGEITYNSDENCITFGFSTNQLPANSGIISGTGSAVFISDFEAPDELQNQYVAEFNWTCYTGESFYNLSNAVLTETAQGEYTFEMDSDIEMTELEVTVLLYNSNGENTFYVNMVADPNNARHLITAPDILPLTTPDPEIAVGDGGIAQIQTIYNTTMGSETGPSPWPQYSVTPLA